MMAAGSECGPAGSAAGRVPGCSAVAHSPCRPQTQPSQPRSTGGADGAGRRPATHTRSVTPSTISPASSSGRARNRIVDSPPVTQGSTPASSIAPASAERISTARRRALSAVTTAVSHPQVGRPRG